MAVTSLPNQSQQLFYLDSQSEWFNQTENHLGYIERYPNHMIQLVEKSQLGILGRMYRYIICLYLLDWVYSKVVFSHLVEDMIISAVILMFTTMFSLATAASIWNEKCFRQNLWKWFFVKSLCLVEPKYFQDILTDKDLISINN